MRKINIIQSLRGFAVLFVVFFHIYVIENKYSGFGTLLSPVVQVGSFGVDLFFVVSGFVMVTVTRDKFQDLKQALRFLYHRLTRIYPLYWIYTLMALAVFLIKPEWINVSEAHRPNILHSFLLLPSINLPLVEVGWTLIHEIYFYLVYFFIFLLLPENLLIYALGGWGGIILIMDLTVWRWNPYTEVIFHPLTFEFLSGCVLALMYYQIERSRFSKPVLLTAVVIALVFAIVSHDYYHNSPRFGLAFDWARTWLWGIPAWIIVYCLLYAERNGFAFPLYMTKVGDASYSIYLSHLFTISVIGRLWTLVSVEGYFDNFLFIVVTLAVVLFVGFLSYWLVERKLLELSRKFEIR